MVEIKTLLVRLAFFTSWSAPSSVLSTVTAFSTDTTGSIGTGSSSSPTPLPPFRQQRRRNVVSVVTGANGYLGREIVSQLVLSTPTREQQQQQLLQTSLATTVATDTDTDTGTTTEVICLVRARRVEAERDYWNGILLDAADRNNNNNNNCKVTVMPYDMLDDGISLSKALDYVYSKNKNNENDNDNDNMSESSMSCVVYHVASVFGPTENHQQTALDNVKGSEDVVKVVAQYGNNNSNDDDNDDDTHHTNNKPTLVITSSMAAVRASNQEPQNGKWYTFEDWNTESKLGVNWGQSYQWSKAESERQCWNLAKQLNVTMISLCPSFVFGPLRSSPPSSSSGSTKSVSSSSSSYSIELVNQWLHGESEVQSRLCVDVRDAAHAHIMAAQRSRDGDHLKTQQQQQRYLLTAEARLSSTVIADMLQDAVRTTTTVSDTDVAVNVDVDSICDKIVCDTKFDGGAIPIGNREVECQQRLEQELGVICRPTEETIKDMAVSLLQLSNNKNERK